MQFPQTKKPFESKTPLFFLDPSLRLRAPPLKINANGKSVMKNKEHVIDWKAKEEDYGFPPWATFCGKSFLDTREVKEWGQERPNAKDKQGSKEAVPTPENLTPGRTARALFREPVAVQCDDFDGNLATGTKALWEQLKKKTLSTLAEHQFDTTVIGTMVLKRGRDAVKKAFDKEAKKAANASSASIKKDDKQQCLVPLSHSTSATWPHTTMGLFSFSKEHNQLDMPRETTHKGKTGWHRSVKLYCNHKNCNVMDENTAKEKKGAVLAAKNCRIHTILEGSWRTQVVEGKEKNSKPQLISTLTVTKVFLHNHLREPPGTGTPSKLSPEASSFRDGNEVIPLLGIGHLKTLQDTFGPFVEHLKKTHTTPQSPPPGQRISNYFSKPGEGTKYQFDRRFQEPIPTYRGCFRDLIPVTEHLMSMLSLTVFISSLMQCADEFTFDHQIPDEKDVFAAWAPTRKEVPPVHLSICDPMLIYGGAQLVKGKVPTKKDKDKLPPCVGQPLHKDFTDVTRQQVEENLPVRLKEHPHTVRVLKELDESKDTGPWTQSTNPFLVDLGKPSSVSIPLDTEGRTMVFLEDGKLTDRHIPHGDGLLWGAGRVHAGKTHPHGTMPPWHPRSFSGISSNSCENAHDGRVTGLSSPARHPPSALLSKVGTSKH